MSFWYAFRTDDPAKVVEHLELKETRPCSFAEHTTSLVGVEETMFVTPSTGGWVLAFGEWPARDVELRVELASLTFGEAQAFASDDASGRRAWLRARDGKWLRAMVFDGEGYPLTRGRRAKDEPQFPQLLATPGDDDVRRMARAWSIDPRAAKFRARGVLGKRDVTIRIDKNEDESGRSYGVRTGVMYIQHRWDDDVYEGPGTGMNTGPFSLAWPRAWGKPKNAGDGGSLVWSLPDAEVLFQARQGIEWVPKSIHEWLEVRRRLHAETGDGWSVFAGKQLHHDFGVGMETGEAASDPRRFRALRFLFAPPWMFICTLTCPDEIPHARGRELAWLYYTIRVGG